MAYIIVVYQIGYEFIVISKTGHELLLFTLLKNNLWEAFIHSISLTILNFSKCTPDMEYGIPYHGVAIFL